MKFETLIFIEKILRGTQEEAEENLRVARVEVDAFLDDNPDFADGYIDYDDEDACKSYLQLKEEVDACLKKSQEAHAALNDFLDHDWH